MTLHTLQEESHSTMRKNALISNIFHHSSWTDLSKRYFETITIDPNQNKQAPGEGGSLPMRQHKSNVGSHGLALQVQIRCAFHIPYIETY